jgi:single-strand DNA-binding protein
MNQHCIIGYVGREPELRTTNTGKNVVEFSVGVTKRFNREETDWFRVKAWGQTAEFVAKHITKGRLVSVVGSGEMREYTTQTGEKRTMYEITAEQVNPLDRPRDDGQNRSQGNSGGRNGGSTQRQVPQPAADEYDPFADE